MPSLPGVLLQDVFEISSEEKVELTSTAAILALDPGEHIGYTILEAWEEAHSEPGLKTSSIIGSWGVRCIATGSVRPSTPVDVVDAIDELFARANSLDSEKFFAVVEHFTFTRVSAYGGSRLAVEMFGIVKTILRYRYPKFQLETRQTPADVKSVIGSGVLRELGVQQRGSGQTDHALMAGRHAVLAVARMRNRELAPHYNEMTQKL